MEIKSPMIETDPSHPQDVREFHRENVKLLQLLRIFHENLATALDLKTFFHRCYEIVPLISKSLDVNRISMLLCDEKTQSLIDHELIGEDFTPVQLRSEIHPVGHSISGKCLELERPIMVEDCSQTEIIPQEWIEKLNLKSTLAVPIRVKQKAIGVMRIDNTERIHRFSELEIEFFSTLADQLGIMIENARLFTERKQAGQALRESEERFRNIVGSSPIGVFMYELQSNRNLVLTGANPAT